MTGWRIGWICGPEDQINELAKCNHGICLSVASVTQRAALAALTADDPKYMYEEYDKRRKVVMRRLKKLGWNYIKPEGAFYVFPNIRQDAWKFSLELLNHKKVAVLPGDIFGPSGKEHIRICYGASPVEKIEEGFDRIEKFVN